jgi:phosphoglycolate phosphatase
LSAVLFDLDGTLADPFEGIAGCIRHALRALGANVPDDPRLRRCIGPPLREVFGDLLDTEDPDRVDAAVGLYRERFDTHGILENRVYAGIPALLADVRSEGWRACVVTSKPQPYAERILRHLELADFFQAVYGSGLDGTRAAKDELFAHALASENLPPHDAIAVGDRHHDVDGARAVGLDAIGVTWGFGESAELEAAGAARLCASPAALLAALRERFGGPPRAAKGADGPRRPVARTPRRLAVRSALD